MAKRGRPKKTREVKVKPVPKIKKEQPGRWAILCDNCQCPALVLTGEKVPPTNVSLENIPYTMASPKSRKNPILPKFRQKPVCGQCGHNLSMGPYNHIVARRCINLDVWLPMKGVFLGKYGYRNRDPKDPNDGSQVLTLNRVPLPLLHKANEKWAQGEGMFEKIDAEEVGS